MGLALATFSTFYCWMLRWPLLLSLAAEATQKASPKRRERPCEAKWRCQCPANPQCRARLLMPRPSKQTRLQKFRPAGRQGYKHLLLFRLYKHQKNQQCPRFRNPRGRALDRGNKPTDVMASTQLDSCRHQDRARTRKTPWLPTEYA